MAVEPRPSSLPRSFLATASGTLAAARSRATALSTEAAGRRFWITLLLLWLCQLADLVSFKFAVQTFGPEGELGPLSLVYEAAGFWGVAAVKLGLIGVVMAVLARYPWRRLATRRRMALIFAAIGAFGAFTNVMAFVWLV